MANSIAWLIAGMGIVLFATLVVLPNVSGFLGAFFGWTLALIGVTVIVYNFMQIISPPLN